MKDRIVAAFLKDFVAEFGLENLEESETFEHFVNYSLISKHHPEEFDPEDVHVGGPGDLGLDGIGILVNDHLVFSREAVDHLKLSRKRLDVQFIFLQAKTSPSFEAAGIGAFVSGVRSFFEKTEPPAANERIRELHDIKEYIFDSSIDMDTSPTCLLYYATTGVWKEEVAVVERVQQGTLDLNGTGLFSAVELNPIDSDGLQAAYRQLHHKIVREMVFEKHTLLPSIVGVPEAYIGVVPCTEYLRLICDDDGMLNRRLFYDNVRDFQGNNPVNMEIEETILDASRSDRFALLNNGITIVAAEVNKVGASFKLKDFQIVNGCQTSHVLYRNREHLSPELSVPVKLIVTTDVEVINQVIQGTNRQTEVLLEAFESLAPFQKKLEALYNAMSRDRKESLYYERRSKQYEHLNLRKDQVITLATQINCFVAMFLNEPHSVHRYYGELLTSYRTRLFSESHSPLPYFAAGAALTTLERLFSAGSLPRSWRRWRFQILMVLRLQNEPSDLPPLNSPAIDKYCDKLLELFDDPSRMEAAAARAGKEVEAKSERLTDDSRNPLERTRAFTESLFEVASAQRQGPARTLQTEGVVDSFSDVRGYGFIDGDDGKRAFVHYSDIVGQGYRSLRSGQRVRYAAIAVPRGTKAVDVEPVAASSQSVRVQLRP